MSATRKLRQFGIVVESAGPRQQDVPIESFLFGSHLTDRLIVSFNLPAQGKARKWTAGRMERTNEFGKKTQRVP